jgi:hypothetical protein
MTTSVIISLASSSRMLLIQSVFLPPAEKRSVALRRPQLFIVGHRFMSCLVAGASAAPCSRLRQGRS